MICCYTGRRNGGNWRSFRLVHAPQGEQILQFKTDVLVTSRLPSACQPAALLAGEPAVVSCMWQPVASALCMGSATCSMPALGAGQTHDVCGSRMLCGSHLLCFGGNAGALTSKNTQQDLTRLCSLTRLAQLSLSFHDEQQQDAVQQLVLSQPGLSTLHQLWLET